MAPNFTENYGKSYPELESKLNQEREDFQDLLDIYPAKKDIFRAFQLCPLENLKIIIIGQDPYHQPKQAQGLAFSVNSNVAIPPSLQNIFKEIKSDLQKPNVKIESGDLSYLAKQGILLLNTTLTVRQGKPNSHLKLWKGFTKKIVNYILEEKKDIIFMLWGNNAKSLVSKNPSQILEKHHIFKSTHPSPLSANRGGWFGVKMFSKVNQKLKEIKNQLIGYQNE